MGVGGCGEMPWALARLSPAGDAWRRSGAPDSLEWGWGRGWGWNAASDPPIVLAGEDGGKAPSTCLVSG